MKIDIGKLKRLITMEEMVFLKLLKTTKRTIVFSFMNESFQVFKEY